MRTGGWMRTAMIAATLATALGCAHGAGLGSVDANKRIRVPAIELNPADRAQADVLFERARERLAAPLNAPEAQAMYDQLDWACLHGSEGACDLLNENTTPPEYVRRSSPRYTSEAVRNGVGGEVVVSCTEETDGTVRACQVLAGLPHGMTSEVVSSFEQSLLKPQTFAGHPVRVRRRNSVLLSMPGRRMMEAEVIRRWHQATPQDPHARRALALMLDTLRPGWGKPCEAADRALTLLPDDPSLLELNARCALAAGNLERALHDAAASTRHATRQRYITASNVYAVRGECAEVERLRALAAKLPGKPAPEQLPCEPAP